jgi:hypothetical protein
MRPEAWNIAYGDSNVAWESGARQGVMRVNLAGTTGSVSYLLQAVTMPLSKLPVCCINQVHTLPQ